MPSHFSTLGFDVTDEDAFAALVRRLAAEAAPLESRRGTYLRWADASGVEVWLKVGARRELVGAAPHFSGPSRLRAVVTNALARRADTPLDGAFHAWAEPEPGEEHRLHPFVFDCPCPGLHEGGGLAGPALLQIAAFAHELEVYASAEAYAGSARHREGGYAERSFIPAGLFRSEGEEPQSTAALSGTVLAAERRVNGLTGAPFQWARVASLGGELDVVVDPALCPDPPPVGGVVAGFFWLSAKPAGA